MYALENQKLIEITNSVNVYEYPKEITSFFALKKLTFLELKFYDICFDQPEDLLDQPKDLTNLLQLIIKKEKVTQIKFSRNQDYLHYCIEIEHSETTYHCLVNYTVKQTESDSLVEIVSTDKGKHFEFVLQSLNGPKQFIDKDMLEITIF